MPASSSRLLAMDSSNSAAACIRSVKVALLGLFLSLLIFTLATRSLISAPRRRQCVSDQANLVAGDFRLAFWHFALKIAHLYASTRRQLNDNGSSFQAYAVD
jgi:hypothetical protein